MLRDSSGRVVSRVRDGIEIQRLCERLLPAEREPIHNALRAWIDQTAIGSAISASSISARDWAGGPFEPIYAKIFPGSYEASAMLLGHLMRQAVIDHPGEWKAVRKPKNADDPEGVKIMLYWREG